MRCQGLVVGLFGSCLGVSKRVSGAGLILLVLLALACGAAYSGDGRAMAYSVLPRADYLKWDKDVGLEDGFIYGGSLGIDLDHLVALRGYLLTNPEIATDLGRISAEAADRNLRLTNYGADVILNLNEGQLVPFLKFGGGILRFSPDTGEVFEQIALRAGGGLRYEIAPGIYSEVTVEDLFCKIDPAMLSAGGCDLCASDPCGNRLRSNLAASARLGVNLSGGARRTAAGRGRMFDRGLGERLTGGTWMIEPYSGRLRFDDPSDLGNHEIIGGRLGTNLTDNFDLCGYYWRGMKKGYESTEDLQSYGIEAELLLGRGRGAVPYLLMGAGKLDFLGDFRDPENRQRSDKALLIVGGGVGFLVNDYLKVSVAARDYMLTESDLDEVGSPDELRHSLALTGGLSLLVGGKRPVGPRAAAAHAAPEPRAATRGPADARLSDEAVPSYQADKNVIIPAPAVGEIYVRYGEPGAVSVVSGQPLAAPGAAQPSVAEVAPQAPPQAAVPGAPAVPGVPGAPGAAGMEMGIQDREALRRMIDEEIVAALRASGAAARPDSVAAGPDQAELVARRIADSVEQRLKAAAPAQPTTIIVERPQEGPAPAPIQEAGVIPPIAPGEVKVEAPKPAPGLSRASKAYTYTGVNLDDPVQWLVGARFDAGPVRRGSKIWVVPEVEFGLFNKGSLMMVANAQYDFDASVSIRRTRITPYIYAGAGLLHFGKGAGRDRNEAVLNLGYGLTFDIRKLNAYVEHQGVDLYSLHRLILGVRWAAPKITQ